MTYLTMTYQSVGLTFFSFIIFLQQIKVITCPLLCNSLSALAVPMADGRPYAAVQKRLRHSSSVQEVHVLL